MALFNSLRAVLIPMANPSVDTSAMNVKQIGDLGRGKTVGAEEEGLESQSDARGLIGLGFLAQG
jgi:hypothetical protein